MAEAVVGVAAYLYYVYLLFTSSVCQPAALDISLAVVFMEYYMEQFKGLSCCVPSGQHVHPFGLLRAFFFALSALICAAVWQVNGAQHQTPWSDLQSDLI